MNNRILLLIASTLFSLHCFSQQETKADLTGVFTDLRDGQKYQWILIGGQVWMAQNLNFERPKGSSCYNYDTTYCNTYGRLYDWESAMEACPSGWHLPTDEEWNSLSENFGNQAGMMLKEAGTKHWEGPNDGAVTGDSGFNALPAGSRGDRGMKGENNYNDIGTVATFWSSTAAKKGKVWTWFLYYLDDEFHRFENYKVWGFSVRCIKNSVFPETQ